MDSFNIQNIKIEKAKALLRYRSLQQIIILFRFIELCAILIILSRFSCHLPTAFNISGEYFRGLSVTLVSPRFVFVVGNAIIIILFLKSGRVSVQEKPTNGNSISFCDESIDNMKKHLEIHGVEEESKKQRMMIEEQKVQVCKYNSKHRKIHRSLSEKIPKVYREEESRPELRRSATENSWGIVGYSEKQPAAVVSYAEDEMSSEEFRRTVEDFIARQQRFLREEEFSSVVPFEA